MTPSTAIAAPDPGGDPGDQVARATRQAAVIPINAPGRRTQRRGRDGASWQVDGTLALKVGPGECPTADPAVDPDATRTAVLVARGMLEVLSGWRPAHQLSRWTSLSLQDDLERRAPRRPTGRRQQLIRVRVSEPAPGVAEVCALTHDFARGRVRVMALRLEKRGQRWILTRLQAG